MDKNLNGKLHWIDLIKGFAMLSVIADHSGLPLWGPIDYFEVPAFFIVSGLLFKPGRRFGEFMRRKSIRIIPSYFVYALAYILIMLPFTGATFSPNTLLMMMVTPANYPLWFLKALFWALIGLWGISSLGHLANLRNSISVFCALYIVGVLTSLLTGPNSPVLLTGLPQGVIALPLMVAGVSLMRYIPEIEHILRTPRRLYAVTVVMIILAVALARGHIHYHAADIGTYPWTFYPLALLVFGAMLLISMCIHEFAPIEYVGRNSMQFFCIHAIPIMVMRKLGIDSPWVILAGAIAVTTGTVWALGKVHTLRRWGLA